MARAIIIIPFVSAATNASLILSSPTFSLSSLPFSSTRSCSRVDRRSNASSVVSKPVGIYPCRDVSRGGIRGVRRCVSGWVLVGWHLGWMGVKVGVL